MPGCRVGRAARTRYQCALATQCKTPCGDSVSMVSNASRGKLPATPDCRDKFDLPFLQLAVVGKADFLVTGDQDLLALVGQFACAIITADQFMKTLNK